MEDREQTADLDNIGAISGWHKVKRETLLLPKVKASLRHLQIHCRNKKKDKFASFIVTGLCSILDPEDEAKVNLIER